MSGYDFFNCVTHRIDQMMGALFAHKGVSPAELKSMDFAELKYWHDWSEMELEIKRKQLQDLENAKGK